MSSMPSQHKLEEALKFTSANFNVHLVLATEVDQATGLHQCENPSEWPLKDLPNQQSLANARSLIAKEVEARMETWRRDNPEPVGVDFDKWQRLEDCQVRSATAKQAIVFVSPDSVAVAIKQVFMHAFAELEQTIGHVVAMASLRREVLNAKETLGGAWAVFAEEFDDETPNSVTARKLAVLQTVMPGTWIVDDALDCTLGSLASKSCFIRKAHLDLCRRPQ